MKIVVKGIDAVSKNLEAVVGNIQKGARIGMLQAAMIIESESKGLAPVDTANLRASHFIFRKNAAVPQPRILPAAGVDVTKLKNAFTQTMARSQNEVKDENTVRVGAAAFYAVYVEFGNPAKNWNRGGPNFLRTARNRNTNNILMLAAQGAKNGLV